MKKMFVKNIQIDEKFDPEILNVSGCAVHIAGDHKEVARQLRNKNPYVVIVILENLDSKFWNNKRYVEKTKIPINTLWEELLYTYFFEEFGYNRGNEVYGEWLSEYKESWKKDDQSENIDAFIVKKELESRYGSKILLRYKNKEKLFAPRIKIKRDRRYDLPDPLNRVDWRSPYDAIFVWTEDGKKVFCKGGMGSSGARERYSAYVYGLSLMNQVSPIRTFLFRYGSDNAITFIREFSSFTVPKYGIGENYFLGKGEDEEDILLGTHMMQWKDFSTLKEVYFS